MRQRIAKGYQRGHFWELFQNIGHYTLFVDGSFWCSCDSRREAYDELEEV